MGSLAGQDKAGELPQEGLWPRAALGCCIDDPLDCPPLPQVGTQFETLCLSPLSLYSLSPKTLYFAIKIDKSLKNK